jgi:xylulokinase
MEGVAFNIREQLDLIRTGGATVTELRVSGGDARLTTWNQIKADVIGVPVVPVPGDAAVGGVAMLAGLGAGHYDDVEDAVRRCVRPSAPIEPDRTTLSLYNDRFRAWRELATAGVVRQSH